MAGVCGQVRVDKCTRGQAWRVDKCATVLRLLGCQARPDRIPRHNDHRSVRQHRTHVVLTAPPCSPAGTQPTKLHFYAALPTTSAGEAAQPARPSQGRCCHATPPTCTHSHICMPTTSTSIPTRTGMRSRCKTTVRGRSPVVHVAATAWRVVEWARPRALVSLPSKTWRSLEVCSRQARRHTCMARCVLLRRADRQSRTFIVRRCCCAAASFCGQVYTTSRAACRRGVIA